MMIINHIKTTEEFVKIDDGFFFGCGAFETILMLKEPVLLPEHINRLNEALCKLNINKHVKENEILMEISQLNVSNCAVKITVTNENIIVSSRNFNYPNTDYENGVTLMISEYIRSSKALSTWIKSLNYLDLLYENQNAKYKGFFDSLLLNEKGEVCETCFSNIFFIKENHLYTPSAECGLLKGVIRDWIIKNYPVEKAVISKNDISGFDGCFITNSLMGVMPVSAIDEIKMSDRSLTGEIQSSYQKFLKKYNL